VTVLCLRPVLREEQGPADVPPTLMPTESLIPEKYSAAADSPLRFVVKEDRNEYAIVLE